MKELMVDLETFGNSVDAPIVQIGAAYFSMETGEVGDTFMANVAGAIENGAVADESTIRWWLAQSKEARESLTDKDVPMLKEVTALREFNWFAKKATRVWSHATFDFVILQSAMRRRGIKPKFHYRTARDIRTLTGLINIKEVKKVEREGTHHNALDDALYQIKYCHVAYKTLKGEQDEHKV